ncbi:MAG: preprotein translocase subunit SecY [Lentisphaerae bacterium GWF2_44_16]|nr:MAG: preprotein translocase subunit SecY [Lentisphaerae bacterium GWF2_44_16]
MFSAFLNSIKIKELRGRILFTAGIIILDRLAANIPCPGVDPSALKQYFSQFGQGSAEGMFMGMFDIFSGGALQQFAIATLGIMPYISASIIMQLLTPVLPSLEKLAREGDVGRQKINQYTRYLTVVICIIQGAMAALAMINPGRLGLPHPQNPLVTNPGSFFVIMTVIVLTCATMILVWFGEQITERGIGNGISLIITVNIIARMPAAMYGLYEIAVSHGTISGTRFRLVHLLILFIIFILVTAATIVLTQGQRRIPIQMAKRIVGNKMKGGTTYMPLKVNFSGVMPIIFAGAILVLPGILLRWIPFAREYAVYFQYGSTSYMIIYGIMILAFSYFWVANQFNPIQIADNLKKEGAYIPGIRPGQPTADFLDNTMTRVTLAGSIFLAALAVFPMFLYKGFKIPYNITSFFGGTSLLIMVGVLLDTLSQMESHLTMRNYDGFLKHGKVRSRRQ